MEHENKTLKIQLAFEMSAKLVAIKRAETAEKQGSLKEDYAETRAEEAEKQSQLTQHFAEQTHLKMVALQKRYS